MSDDYEASMWERQFDALKARLAAIERDNRDLTEKHASAIRDVETWKESSRVAKQAFDEATQGNLALQGERNQLRAELVAVAEQCASAERELNEEQKANDHLRAGYKEAVEALNFVAQTEAAWHMSGTDRPTKGCRACAKIDGALATAKKLGVK